MATRPALPALPRFDDRAVAIDAGAAAIVSVAICAAADALVFMTIFVPIVLAARLLVLAARPRTERGTSMKTELIFFGLCTVLGAFNDWNSVVRHGVYAYDVPHWFPGLSSIPLWMLLFWGMILRLFFTLSRWRRLDPPDHADDELWIGPARRSSPWLKVTFLLALVLLTRQFIYRFYLDPLWSWAPFALALLIYAAFTRPRAQQLRLVALFVVGGPATEILYIQVGHLHHYALGWLGGVPIWIALWWVLVILIWQDLGARALAIIEFFELGVRASTPRPGA